MQGRFREQEALVGACCITKGKVLGAVEEREEDPRGRRQRPPAITAAEPSQAGKPLTPAILSSLVIITDLSPTWQTLWLGPAAT